MGFLKANWKVVTAVSVVVVAAGAFIWRRSAKKKAAKVQEQHTPEAPKAATGG